MHKKLLIICIIITLLVGASMACILLLRSQKSAEPKRLSGIPIPAMSMKQALTLRHTNSCLRNNASFKAEVESIPGLSEDSGIYTEEIYDVPAGTNVGVSISSYDGTSNTIEGSLVYSGQYGSYNFLLQKQSDGWRYVAFIRCG